MWPRYHIKNKFMKCAHVSANDANGLKIWQKHKTAIIFNNCVKMMISFSGIFYQRALKLKTKSSKVLSSVKVTYFWNSNSFI